ncbi:MAG: VanZ family protein [Spirochaetaceae bacterium]|nr:VanZ family protein [Spirochaetaceae bacterium]
MNLKEFSLEQKTALNEELMSKSKFPKIFSIISTIFILIASLLPPSHAIQVRNFPLADKGEHMSAYAVLGFFLFLSFADLIISKKLLENKDFKINWIKAPFFQTLLFGVPLGVIIEIIQIFVGRTFDIFDMLADTIGLAVGCTFAILIMQLFINSIIKKIKSK